MLVHARFIFEKPLQYTVEQCSFYSSLFPLSRLATLWRLDRYFTFLDLIPIRAECSTTTLLETFHHRFFGVIIGTGEEILEELVERAVASYVGIFCACFRLF